MHINKYPFKSPVVCLVCGIKLKSLFGDDYENVGTGAVGSINVGYGSENDGDIIQIGLCDSCIKELKKQGKIRILWNHIFGDTDPQ